LSPSEFGDISGVSNMGMMKIRVWLMNLLVDFGEGA